MSGFVIVSGLLGAGLVGVGAWGLHTRRRLTRALRDMATRDWMLEAVKARELALQQTLLVRPEAEVAGRVRVMNQMAETIEAELAAAVGQLSTNAEQMQDISAAIAAGAERSGSNAIGSGEAADVSVESARRLAHTADSLNLAIQRIAEQVGQATDVVATAVHASDEAKRVIATLAGQAASIQAVVDLIRSIAEQTNLLALNATIEAARAGEAGRGFAVVASEVKSLARKTAQATDGIVRTIAAIGDANTQAVGAVDRIGAAVAAIDRIATEISGALNEQRTVAGDIAHSINDTVDAASGLSERIAGITEEVGRSFETAADVHLVAGEIAGSTATLLGEFRHVIARAVRTSAPEVNRRRSPRRIVNFPCLLEVAGMGACQGRVVDVSDGGARLMIPTGGVAPGVVLSDGIEADLSFTGDSGPTRRPAKLLGVLVSDASWIVRLCFTDAVIGQAGGEQAEPEQMGAAASA